MRVYYCDHFELPLPVGHRFPIAKYHVVRQRLQTVGIGCLDFRVAPAATFEQLSLVHSAEYLRKVFDGKLSQLEQRRIGFPWSLKMLERCRRSTGATIATGFDALCDGVAVHLSGGTHHAFADNGQGFCVFNDVAVAIRVMQQMGKLQRSVVIDLDVHQGNGTAAIFADDPSVFTFSIHGDRNYPFQKMLSDLDVALPDKTGDDDYLIALEGALQKLPMYSCDCIFYLAGADPYAGDRMGRLELSKAGLVSRDEMVLQFCRARNLPVAVVLAGGYAAIEDIADIHTATVLTALKFHGRVGD